MITVVGVDMALANMGLVRANINPQSLAIAVTTLRLVSTEKMDKKLVRKSSDDLRRAQELLAALHEFCVGASVAFAEVPSGSLSATAARALGIAVGVLAGCRIPIIEVSQQEVKLASVGKKTASKDEMIAWAIKQYPQAQWLTKKSKGTVSYTNANEHLADACAVLSAGIKTPAFKQAFAMQTFLTAPARKRITWTP